MIVDCDRCVVRGDACQDCVISLLLGAPPGADVEVREDRGPGRSADIPIPVGKSRRLRLIARSGGEIGASSDCHRRSAERSAGSAERSQQQVS
ncbi:hypothetical protein LX15_003810 [Streptoalloteichus tenebrarius]|uniref:Uncharacterized protein n=1 Tax=Streptoalloteichus tenebrarius (strain ATCC 17920 / DSM 40477 / JCM 4838 / CBS 697.72 / NBRC 16177 / NCIMB 11028 / NRRL B-12390 / A12253. 1 / ISP 5477) TaxID=1933 RepID=A0ABT1HX55_STRSD|nr:hypothetical protein [Streptoalloteichus tenebrarius]MCP2260099.1 hypothetical protein [Streptoalloteichus tenebrarius]BFF00581.1 hypothetical protein GCM10020241_22560 [Streptoalloteichus tenebrarius]